MSLLPQANPKKLVTADLFQVMRYRGARRLVSAKPMETLAIERAC